MGGLKNSTNSPVKLEFISNQCMELNQNRVRFKMVDRPMRTVTIMGHSKHFGERMHTRLQK